MTFHIAAVVAAAGFSSRMGRFKPLLPFGRRTAVAMVIHAFAVNRVEPIIIVGGHRFPELASAVAGTGAACIRNPVYPQGMFSSFKHGFRMLPKNIHAVFAHPVDMPLIPPEVVQRMCRVFENSPGAVIYPRHKGTPGRPVLVPYDLLDDILQSDDNGGLRVVLEGYLDRFRFVDVDHPGILWDMDRMPDYHRLEAFHRRIMA
jgi:CTP:molybdopterin cytidylyltransferase MocA